MSSDDASIDRLTAAAWAAGFAMAPTEADAVEANGAPLKPETSRWRSALPARPIREQALSVLGMRQWLSAWQWRPTA